MKSPIKSEKIVVREASMKARVSEVNQKKFSYHFDHSANLVVVKKNGPISVSEEIALIKEIVSASEFKKGMNALCDMTEADLDWSLQDIDQFRAFVRSNSKQLGTPKWAVLSTGGATLSSAKLFIILHDIHPGDLAVKLFSNKFDAIKWLNSTD